MLSSGRRYRGMAVRASQRACEPSSRRRCGCRGAVCISRSPPCTSSGGWWTTLRGWLHFRSHPAASRMLSLILVARRHVGWPQLLLAHAWPELLRMLLNYADFCLPRLTNATTAALESHMASLIAWVAYFV